MKIELEKLEGKNAEIKRMKKHSMVLMVDGIEIYVGARKDYSGREPVALLDVDTNRLLDADEVENKDFIKL